MLSKTQFDNIKKLANLDIKNEQEFLDKLTPIIEYLENIQKIDTSDITDKENNKFINIIKQQTNFDNQSWILQNAKHQQINNSIIIKSPIK